jgi:hypothetical protein
MVQEASSTVSSADDEDAGGSGVTARFHARRDVHTTDRAISPVNPPIGELLLWRHPSRHPRQLH